MRDVNEIPYFDVFGRHLVGLHRNWIGCCNANLGATLYLE
ncbi:hypothetical protein FHR72_003864 [Mycolicibacterium iranicum]|uniref:Uncharacterized protein n=1 Tax=Mycolicibacterium iranicum TaxID=912594 RepID=A0A839QCY9_MYCIR|nr:hypothetical protein [Mycolicibacterium iranicum]